MKFTLSWLKEHIDIDDCLSNILRRLTLLGLEVESFKDPSIHLAPFVIAQIQRIEKHPNADRLNVCYVKLDHAEDQPLTQVVCGAPNVYTGMKTVFAHVGTYVPGLDSVLKKGKIRDVESFGMLCSFEELGLDGNSSGIIDLPSDAPLGVSYSNFYNLGDPSIEIGITPNRADCLGVRGIARDLAAAGLGTLKPSKELTIKPTFDATITPYLPEKECSAFRGRIIRNVRNCESPDWLIRRLKAVGIKPISAIVDITNYVAHDLCRPLHSYDLNTLSGNVSVRFAKESESFTGLDSKDYTLNSSHFVVADESKVIALAGVLGSLNTSTTLDTTSVLLESAIFDAITVQKTARDLNIHSDARMRFERGVDPQSIQQGLDLATQLILDICGGEASEIISSGAVPHNSNTIEFNLKKIQEIAGISVSKKKVEGFLSGLGCINIVWKNDHTLELQTPSWRFDLATEYDLVEEVLRLQGYDSIPSIIMDPERTTKPLSVDQSNRLYAKKVLATYGLNECIHYSFINEKAAHHFKQEKELVEIANPISSYLSHMRPSILPSLMESAARNFAYNVKNLSLFEMGSVYGYNSLGDPVQESSLGVLLSGVSAQKDWKTQEQSIDFFDIKRVLGMLLDAFDINPNMVVLETTNLPEWLHPGQSAVIKLTSKVVIGYIGRIHPKTEKMMDCTSPIFACELYFDRLPIKNKKNGVYVPNKLPSVERDFAFIVDTSVLASNLLKAVRNADKTYIQNVELFDIYAGKGLPENTLSMALRVTLQPTDATFSDDQLQSISQAIIASVQKNTGATLRA